MNPHSLALARYGSFSWHIHKKCIFLLCPMFDVLSRYSIGVSKNCVHQDKATALQCIIIIFERRYSWESDKLSIRVYPLWSHFVWQRRDKKGVSREWAREKVGNTLLRRLYANDLFSAYGRERDIFQFSLQLAFFHSLMFHLGKSSYFLSVQCIYTFYVQC